MQDKVHADEKEFPGMEKKDFSLMKEPRSEERRNYLVRNNIGLSMA
jgi:hypothetical protein